MGIEFLRFDNGLTPRIVVIGVGGGGSNAVDYMVQQGARNIEFVVANTDHQALTQSKASQIIPLGESGLGAGSRPEVGTKAAQDKREEIIRTLSGADLVFVTAGMGGGTGTGAAPVIAKIAKELGILTIAVVTKPFSFEGGRRARIADQGVDELKSVVDSMIVILNENLERTMPDNATMAMCFAASNDVLYKACVGIPDIINSPGLINIDFEDLRTVMAQRGMAIIGMATASGKDSVCRAAHEAVSCPLLEGTDLRSAKGLLVYFTASESLSMAEVRKTMGMLQQLIHPNAEVIFGSVLDDAMGSDVRVTVVATGLDSKVEILNFSSR